MALLAFHFSKYYEDEIIRGEVDGTILPGEWEIPLNEKMFIYVSEAESVEEGDTDHKKRAVKIKNCENLKVEELNKTHANMTNYEDVESLVSAINKWHGLQENDIVTFVEFEFV